MNMKTKTEHTPTPLSRAQNRLQYWQEQLAARKKPCNSMTVGSVAVSIEEDKKLDRELIEKAEAAVKDWEEIVRAVNSHEVLLVALRDMSLKFHERCSHEGYFHNCKEPLCVANKQAIAQAEGTI